jgi:glycosyltransferase involved in cell wall biosynthesis
MGVQNKVLLIVPSYSIFGKIETNGNITIRKIRSFPIPIYPGAQLAFPNLITLYKTIAKFQPDIIHTHSPFTLGALGTIFAQILRIPLVSTYHTLFSSTLIYLSPRRFMKGQKLIMKPDSSEKGISERIVWQIQVIFFNIATAVIAPTKIIAEKLKKQGIRTRLVTIPSGLDISEFSCKDDFTPTFKIFHLGRLGLEKSMDVIIHAFAYFVKKFPKATFTLVGDGPAKKSLEHLVKQLKIEKSVTFTGRIEHKDTPALFRAHDIFITASTMETQGLVLLEAMLSGLPVVAAAVNAPIDLVKNGRNGYLFTENDAEMCAKRIEEIYKKNTLEKMGRNARKYAETFDSKKKSQEIVNYYKKLVR